MHPDTDLGILFLVAMAARDEEKRNFLLIAGVLTFSIMLVAIGLALGWLSNHHRRPAPPVTAPAPTSAPTAATPQPAPPTILQPTSPPEQNAYRSPESPNLLLGNPSDATTNAANRNNLLMLKPICAISYNESKGTPNWVSWRLHAEDTGSAPRKATFDTETLLPEGFYLVTHRDYTGSGFDRGHMCPHGDRDASQQTSDATFVMSNIIPQAPAVNEKAWATLERYTRDLVRDAPVTAFIVSGPFGKGGTGSKGYAETLAGAHVTVPAACWKVIVVVPDAEAADPQDIKAVDSRVIAVRMPNDNTAVGMEWTPFRTSPGDIEAETGYHFFTNLKPEVAEMLRTRVDKQLIAPAQPPEMSNSSRRRKAG